MHADYLIVGQGISGSLLSRELMQHNCSVCVIDDNAPVAASRVAGGIINPVTGKRLVRSWMTEQLMPFALAAYTKMEEEWGVKIVRPCGIVDFFYSAELRNHFEEKLESEQEYLSPLTLGEEWSGYFRFNYGTGTIAPCLLVDMAAMLHKCHESLRSHGALREEDFNPHDLVVHEDHIIYRDITAGKVLFCDGALGAANPYFSMLPWSADKGEALILSIPGLPATHIYKQGHISIAPWKDGLFWAGASHDWKYTDPGITAAFRKNMEEQLSYWLKIPYEVVGHVAGLRPANMERKPFVGLHPRYKAVGILNGMGGKGCSMAPYFAHELAAHLTNGSPLTPAVDIKRFERILMKRFG